MSLLFTYPHAVAVFGMGEPSSRPGGILQILRR